MAKYLKRRGDTYVLSGHQPMDVVEELEDKGFDPMSESGYTRYMSLDSEGRGAMLEVQHPREEPNFDERVGWAKEGATELFKHTPAEANYATSNKGMGHTFPKLYAMAIEEFGTVIPSTDRSDFSERLVQKATDMKALPDTPRQATNNMTHVTEPISEGQGLDSFLFAWREVPKHDVQAATNRLRTELGYERRLSPQFEALNKFEESKDTVYDPSKDPNAMQIPGLED